MLRQRIQQKLQQKLSPQQIQLMKLLQVPTIALEQRIKQEVEENVALEEGEQESELDQKEEVNEEESDNNDDEFDLSDYIDPDDAPDYQYQSNNQSKDDEEYEIPFVSGSSFHDLLRNQLSMRDLSEMDLQISEFIIGNLDDSGYLRRETLAMVDDLAFTQAIDTTEENIEKLISLIQRFEPIGVCARNLQECLMLQLQAKAETEPIILAKKIISRFFDAFTKKHYSNITKRLNITDEDLKAGIEEIIKLNPKPGNSLSDSIGIKEHIVPDFILTNIDGKLSLTINGRNAPDLRISRTYKNMLEAYSEQKGKNNKQMKEAMTYVRQKIDSAKWFIDAIKQRQNTLQGTMQAILEYQFDYFQTGDETNLRPMILKDIAEVVHLDISTISRVVNSKYIQTPFGVFKLKTFFSEGMQTQSGEEVSTREIKKILQDSVESESKKKPLTDEKLANLLKEKGYNIARRTIAKYREQLDIPVARLRKEL